MNTSKIIAAVILIAGLALGYMGFTKISDNTISTKVLGVNIDASNESGKQQGYIYLGFAVLLFSGGIYTLNKSKTWFY